MPRIPIRNHVQQNNNDEMSEFNEHINSTPQGQGDPNWQRHFNEASEMPPPRIWDAIERDLDRDKDDRVIIVPFWGRTSTWAWSAAAAIALLLIGWWSLQVSVDSPANQPASMAANQPKAETAKNPSQLSQLRTGTPELASESTERNQPLGRATSTRRSTVSSLQNTQQEQIAAQRAETTPQQEPLSGSPTQTSRLAANQRSRANAPQNNVNNEQTPRSAPTETLTSLTTEKPDVIVSVPKQVESVLATAPELALMDLQPVRLPSMYGTQRIVWFRPSEINILPSDIKSKKAKLEQWASVSVMPSSFNPGVGLLPASATYGNAFAKISSPLGGVTPSLNSQPNLSVAYQVSSGIQLGDRWSVETGVGYLEGRSTVNSPVQTIVSAMAPNGRLSNLYADALNNSRASTELGSNTSSPQAGGGSASGAGGNQGVASVNDAFINTNVYDIARSQPLANNYTFVQVPVQLGYQIRPRKRLGVTVLGGLLTNLFLRNTVNNQLSITATDMVYRPVTLSGATGLRFRYRPTRRWSASMAGIFQQALQRGTRVGADLTTRPQTMGVSVGLDYHF